MDTQLSYFQQHLASHKTINVQHKGTDRLPKDFNCAALYSWPPPALITPIEFKKLLLTTIEKPIDAV
jgi:hypothetical protein